MKELTIRFIDLDDKFSDVLYNEFVYSSNDIKETLLPIEQVEGMAVYMINQGILTDDSILRELLGHLRSYQEQGIENLFIRI